MQQAAVPWCAANATGCSQPRPASRTPCHPPPLPPPLLPISTATDFNCCGCRGCLRTSSLLLLLLLLLLLRVVLLWRQRRQHGPCARGCIHSSFQRSTCLSYLLVHGARVHASCLKRAAVLHRTTRLACNSILAARSTQHAPPLSQHSYSHSAFFHSHCAVCVIGSAWVVEQGLIHWVSVGR